MPNDTLKAVYYTRENIIVLYNERIGRLCEIPFEEYLIWGLPYMKNWKDTEQGKEIEFKLTPITGENK